VYRNHAPSLNPAQHSRRNSRRHAYPEDPHPPPIPFTIAIAHDKPRVMHLDPASPILHTAA
jgi:hypothetical protein